LFQTVVDFKLFLKVKFLNDRNKYFWGKANYQTKTKCLGA